MPGYAWVITTDEIGEGEDEGVIGPRGTRFTREFIENHPRSRRFRMFDGDGQLYYQGVFIDLNEQHSMFEPLDDFGAPNAGCTSIEYQDANTGEWERL